MTSEQNNTIPEWIKQLSTTCPQCNKQSKHMAVIENVKNGVLTIQDYHFCNDCKKYTASKMTGANYALFWKNNLSIRVDPNTGIPFTTKDPRTGSPLLFDSSYD